MSKYLKADQDIDIILKVDKNEYGYSYIYRTDDLHYEYNDGYRAMCFKKRFNKNEVVDDVIIQDSEAYLYEDSTLEESISSALSFWFVKQNKEQISNLLKNAKTITPKDALNLLNSSEDEFILFINKEIEDNKIA